MNRVLEYFFRKPTPSSFAIPATLAWEDWSSTGINGSKSFTFFTRSIPASSFSVLGLSPLCIIIPTSEMTPSRLSLYFSKYPNASS